MNKLFVTWQDKRSRRWFVIGELERSEQTYMFAYLNGALDAKAEAGFRPLLSFPELDVLYESNELFPVFRNRVMPRSRPEFSELLTYLHLPGDVDPFFFLARTGGARTTDHFEVFPSPELVDDRYQLSYFVHGLKYMPISSKDRVKLLCEGEQLYLVCDFQNETEPDALLIKTNDNYLIGYCPSYLLDDFRLVFKNSDFVRLTVDKINDEDAPFQFRLLCKLAFKAAGPLTPFSGRKFRRIQTRTKNVILFAEKAEYRVFAS